MKIIFAGTPAFAAEHLSILLKGDHEIISVLTQPDRKSGRGKRISFSAVKEVALKNNLKVLQPASLKNADIQENLKNLNPDIILVVAYGLLIPKSVLDIPKLGCINLHASLLPRWRGASPIESCIAAGDTQSGITMMKMSEGLDEGPVLKKFICELDERETLGTLENKFIGMSSDNLLTFLRDYENKKINEMPQPESGSTYAHKIDNSFKQLNWISKTAVEIENKIRSLNPKHGAFTYLGEERIKIFNAMAKKDKGFLEPGLFHENSEGFLEVGCKDNSLLVIEALQMPGKKIISSKEFIRGYQSVLSKNLKFS
jgi:methionyl-tRNA formyltransferase